MNKIFQSPEAAVEGALYDGMTIMCGGFGLSGNPESLIKVVRDAGVRQLTIISNNCGADGFGLWRLLANGQIKKMIGSYVGENKLFEQQYLSGELELELNPQGTFAERIRAGGAGIPAFYTRTGVGTVVAAGKPTEVFEGQSYVRESWLRADLALIKAWRADPAGNLMFRKTARNFNPNMVTAAKLSVVEAEEIVPAGTFDPDCVHTPGIYVHRIVRCTVNEKRIERLTSRATGADRNASGSMSAETQKGWTREQMAARAALELRNDYYVNLGVGIPTLVANFIPPGLEVTLQSENGMLGMGAFPKEDEADPDLINAGKQTVTALPTSSFFSSADSFAMIRGSHIDLAILGAMEVAANGDLANWTIPGKMLKGIGGAMDLVAGVQRVIVLMDHTNKKGEPKILEHCTLPLTGAGVVDLIITNLCVMSCDKHAGGGLTLLELAPGVSLEDVRAATAAPFAMQTR